MTSKMAHLRDFPGGPVVQTLSARCRGLGLVPGLGAAILHAAQRNQKKKNTALLFGNSK